MKYIFDNLYLRFYNKFLEYKKVPISKLQMFFKHLKGWYSHDFDKYTLYHTKSGSVFGKRDLKGNYYIQRAWWC